MKALKYILIVIAILYAAENHANIIINHNNDNHYSNSFQLYDIFEKEIIEKNKELNNSKFFDTRILKSDIKFVNKLLIKDQYKKNQAEKITVKTDDNENIECYYFNRGSDKLLVVGNGFTNPKEIMAPFLHMFMNYNVIFFDYRGHGIKEKKFYRLMPINIKKIGLGQKEEKDVIAVVNYLKKEKSIKEIYGLGICYSALIFLKAQAITSETLFNKLILDGTWISVIDFMTKLSKDIKLIDNPQYGGYSNYYPNNKKWFQNFIMYLSKTLFKHVSLEDISVSRYLENITKTPLLYIHGQKDLMVTMDEFSEIWDYSKTTKTAWITNNRHVRNHLKDKELYKFICESFIENSNEKFIQSLSKE